MDRSTAAVGLYHRWGIPTDPVLPPGARRMSNPRCSGKRLKWAWVIDYYHACEYIYKMADALFSGPKRAQASAQEDVPLAEKQTKGDSASVALGGGDPGAEHRGPCKAQAVPHRLQLFAEANPLPGLLPIPSGPPADRQRGDGSGVQDGVHPAAETVRDDMETGGRSVDRRSARHPIERPLASSLPSIPAREDASRNGNSGRFPGENAQKGRIINGMGAITPIREEHDRCGCITGSDYLEQQIGPALVDRQIAQLIEKENGTSVASVTRESGGFMIAQLIEKEKLGTSMIRAPSPSRLLISVAASWLIMSSRRAELARCPGIA